MWAGVPIVVAWLVTAAIMAVALPTLEEAQTGALGQLVPVDSQAVAAERLSAELFAFPLSSRTLVVQRDSQLGVVALVALTVGLYLRSVVAPLATLLTVAVAYLVSIRIVALLGQRLEVSVPPEVEPIVVALLFGV